MTTRSTSRRLIRQGGGDVRTYHKTFVYIKAWREQLINYSNIEHEFEVSPEPAVVDVGDLVDVRDKLQLAASSLLLLL